MKQNELHNRTILEHDEDAENLEQYITAFYNRCIYCDMNQCEGCIGYNHTSTG